MTQMNLFAKQKQTHQHRKWTCGCQGAGVGGCMEMEWVELELGVKWKLLSIQWSFIALLGLESDPKMLELKALTVGSKWMLLLLPVLEPLRQKGVLLKQRDPCMLSAHVRWRQRSKFSPVSCLCRSRQLFPLFCSDTTCVQFPFVSQLITAPSLHSPCLLWVCTTR